jgi:hypothetical protein
LVKSRGGCGIAERGGNARHGVGAGVELDPGVGTIEQYDGQRDQWEDHAAIVQYDRVSRGGGGIAERGGNALHGVGAGVEL